MSTLMVQGTTSDAGKSTLVTALCRWLKRQGVSVVPFKPQNMALNSAVTADGGEIVRAQAVQAQAAGLAPHSDMNPVLLKPSSDTGAQVIIHGRALTSMDAVAYHDYKKVAMAAVLQSHQRLSAAYPVVMVEGAGSPAEINLRAGDIANMGFAEAVDCPVILIADIDKGGVFAHLVGTLALLSESEQARVQGFVINRFRGDIALLQPGLDWLEQRPGQAIPASDLIILPGSKSVRSDLAFLRQQGWPAAIAKHLRYGGKLLGICGGLQILGTQIDDPHGLEGAAGSSPGLGLLEFSTVLEPEKQLRNVRGQLCLENAAVSGYEIHAGVSSGQGLNAAVRLDDGRADGGLSADGQVLGTYLHGLFETPEACSALLRWAGLRDVQSVDYHALRERDIERLADLVEAHLDTARLRKLCGVGHA